MTDLKFSTNPNSGSNIFGLSMEKDDVVLKQSSRISVLLFHLASISTCHRVGIYSTSSYSWGYKRLSTFVCTYTILLFVELSCLYGMLGTTQHTEHRLSLRAASGYFAGYLLFLIFIGLKWYIILLRRYSIIWLKNFKITRKTFLNK